MGNIYKSETTCEHCNESIKWYAIINLNYGDVTIFNESDIFPHRQVSILSSKDKTALLKIRCKACDKINIFSHTLD